MIYGKEQLMALESELWIADKLSKLGFDVHVPANFFMPCCDLVIYRNGGQYRLCVEVKISREGQIKRTLSDGSVAYYPRYQWRVAEVDDRDRVLVLIAEDRYQRRFCFVMPGHIMAERTVFTINSHPAKYSGFMAPFLERWETIDILLHKTYVDPRQMLLFEGAL